MPGPDTQAAEEPAVTVVVVSYFSAGPLRQCLDSVVDQERVDPRVIVVDNGEPAGETETAALCSEYETVEHVPNDRNVGFGTAVNQGFARAETDYLAAINPDATFEEGALCRLVAALDSGAAVAAPKICHAERPDRISTCGLWNHFTGVSFNQAADLPSDRPEWNRERDLGGLSGCAFATTPAAWGQIGGFDEEMFLYKDDVSLSWACQFSDARIRYVPDAVVYHDYERGLDGFKLYNIERSRLLLLAKYLPASAALLLPSLVLTELLTWAMAATLGAAGLRAKLRAYGTVVESDFRSVRAQNGRFRERFPARVDGLRTGIPWRELRRTGIVPDTPVVDAVGGVLNVLFRANVALYRALV